jgi:pilus assembly protein FimV
VNTVSQDGSDAQARLAAIEEQLANLQRIVSLKDDQIAALQGALAEAGVTTASDTGTPAVTAIVGESPGTPAIPEVADANVSTAETTADAVPKEISEPASTAVIPAPVSPEPPKAVPSQAADTAAGSGWTNYLLYVLGALALGAAAFVFSKRRGEKQQEAVPARHVAPKVDVFHDVQLKDQRIKQDVPEKGVAQHEPPEPVRDNRGYGERKHDEYATDIDASEPLAEADIYIAYGRHQQAIDLLNNALSLEPGNPVYRLKLLEIYTELNDHAAANSQLAKIQANGDPDSITRAESLIKRLRNEDLPEPPTETIRKPASYGPGLTPNPLAMMDDSNDTLEADFSGLEIEGSVTSGDDDDLDLSGDFGDTVADRFEDEELVIAADSNGLSTKLDLARAYLDMGDDDGARQILDEVIVEGTEDLKAEAQALLDRIGG